MEINKISDRFNEVAQQYDEQRRYFIPCFDDYYEVGINFLAKTENKFDSILDLGAGTGLLTKYLYQKFPQAHYTLVDVSEQMLKVAKERFFDKENFEFIISDYSKELPTGQFDLITSALSIHHLENATKMELYQNIFNKLEPNGYFINLDQFNAASAPMNEYYEKMWVDHIRQSKITDEEFDMWLRRRELDRENTIDETKELLKQAGFRIVECIYSYMKFGVIVAIK